MLELNRSQKEIQKAAREFAKGEFDKELTVELEKKREYPHKIWKKAADLGFFGIQFPEAYSGGGLGVVEACLIAQELCRKDSTLGMVLTLSGLGAECISRFGGKELQERFLPPIVEGEMLCAVALSETEQGDDIASIGTGAVAEGDQWVINGNKKYVINGGAAGCYVVLCKTDFDAEPEKAFSMIVVESDREGVAATDLGQKLAANMMPATEIRFDNVKVPAGNLIGKAGQGLSQALSFQDEVRLILAAQAVGTAEGALDRALDYVKQREQFDRKLAQFQVIRHKIAEMATKTELARLIAYEAAARFDNGKADTALISMAKMSAAEFAVAVADEAIQLFGGYGYMTESEVEHFYRDAKFIQLYMGTSNSQKDNIAQSVIGKLK